ncbi:unnamed protein product [Rotaria sp. Silwood2]|nr:unnamed protein product [Rotaria sp. Silwood2]CAF2871280.1 unnamed protein product [Rotaria sp. Silwood2]CAF3886988.1 unnamed protein product [Rotaria sp. Silwood2]CAF4086372.1 unnamed protein product [Rotaria sp. Silwood2]
MDLYKHHANKKRKLSKSKEHEKDLKRKDNKNNDKSTSWFGQCCSSRKHNTTPIKNDKIFETSMKKIPLEHENINIQLKPNLSIQSTSNEKVSNIQMTYVKRSSSYNEFTLCQKAFESYNDVCIECTVQYGPDSWEDIHESFQNSNRQLYDNNKSISIEELVTFLDKKINDDDLNRFSTKEKFINKTLNPVKINVNSFINDIIGDGVDRVSDIITMMSTHRNKQNELRIDKKLLTNTENNVQLNESNKTLFDYENRIQNLDSIKPRQYQYSGLVFEKQNLKTMSPLYYHSSIELSLDNTSSTITPDDNYWDLSSNKTNIDQEKVLNKKNSSQNQEPYNWNDQEYPWSSSFDLSRRDHLVDNFLHDQSKQTVINDEDNFLWDNDNDDDCSYTIASVLQSNKTKKAQSYTNDVQNSNPSFDILNQQETLSTYESRENADRIIDFENKNEYNSEKIYSDEFKDQNLTTGNQQQTSITNLVANNNLLLIINSTHSSEVIRDKIPRINSLRLMTINNDVSISSIHNDGSFSKKNISNLHKQQSLSPIDQEYAFIQQNDRVSGSSVSDLFKQIHTTKKQKSIDLDSINTAYSIPVSVHSSVLLETVEDQYNKHNVQSLRTTLSEDCHSISSNTKKKQQKNITIIDTKDETLSTSIKCFQLDSIDKQEKQLLNTEINSNINQSRSTYDDIINSWRRLLERLLGFILPYIRITDNNMNLSSSILSSDTHSWSTLIPRETINMTQSDNIGPWWGRRDTYDQTPATFIFANEPLNTSYSIETIVSNKQMCMSIENRQCYSKYYSYPNICHCCCSSSITINNSSSSS